MRFLRRISCMIVFGHAVSEWKPGHDGRWAVGRCETCGEYVVKEACIRPEMRAVHFNPRQTQREVDAEARFLVAMRGLREMTSNGTTSASNTTITNYTYTEMLA